MLDGACLSERGWSGFLLAAVIYQMYMLNAWWMGLVCVERNSWVSYMVMVSLLKMAAFLAKIVGEGGRGVGVGGSNVPCLHAECMPNGTCL